MTKDSTIQTVLITGSSSGIGGEAAKRFLAMGWNVVATMRNPTADRSLPAHPRLLKLRLDVTDPSSIDAAVAATQRHFGPVHALINNAGYGLVGVFESMQPEQITAQFETNVFGLMRVTQAFLPMLRQTRGVVVNVSSVGGRTTIPLYSIYHASKFAVEGFSESLQYELEALGVRVKLIEPGAVKTDFVGRSSAVAATNLAPYKDYAARTHLRLETEGEKGIAAARVAEAIYSAATDGTKRLRYTVGGQAKFFLSIQSLLPHGAFRKLVAKTFA